MVIVKIVESKLTDGSRVYAVRVEDEGSGPPEFDACGEADARFLAYKIAHAIREHTNEEVREE